MEESVVEKVKADSRLLKDRIIADAIQVYQDIFRDTVLPANADPGDRELHMKDWGIDPETFDLILTGIRTELGGNGTTNSLGRWLETRLIPLVRQDVVNVNVDMRRVPLPEIQLQAEIDPLQVRKKLGRPAGKVRKSKVLDATDASGPVEIPTTPEDVAEMEELLEDVDAVRIPKALQEIPEVPGRRRDPDEFLWSQAVRCPKCGVDQIRLRRLAAVELGKAYWVHPGVIPACTIKASHYKIKTDLKYRPEV